MKTMRTTLLVLVLCSSLAGATEITDPIDDPYRDDVLHLLKMTGSDALAVQVGSTVGNQVFDAIVRQHGDIPEEVRAIAHDEMANILQEEIPKLLEEFVPLYAKYFTHDEIRALIAFYETPVGQKTIQVLPQLMQESMAVGQKWGQSIGPQISERFKQRLAEEGLLPQ